MGGGIILRGNSSVVPSVFSPFENPKELWTRGCITRKCSILPWYYPADIEAAIDFYKNQTFGCTLPRLRQTGEGFLRTFADPVHGYHITLKLLIYFQNACHVSWILDIENQRRCQNNSKPQPHVETINRNFLCNDGD